MTVTPLEQRRSRDDARGGNWRKEPAPWVTWIAFSLGVFLTGTGAILLLWGLSWQSDVISPQNIGEEGLAGGPIVLPLGIFCLGLGIMWLYHGYTGFKRPDEMERKERCPNCHRLIEKDMDFCYHCMTKLERRNPADPSAEGDLRGQRKGPKASDLEGLRGGRGGQRK